MLADAFYAGWLLNIDRPGVGKTNAGEEMEILCILLIVQINAHCESTVILKKN